MFTSEGKGKWPSSMVIGRICDRGSSGGNVRGLETAHASTDSLVTGGGHTILGAAKAPRGANSCLIKVPLPALGGNGVYFNRGSSTGWSLSGLESKAFGESPGVDMSIGVTSFKPCFSGHNGASEWLTAATTMSEDVS